MTAEFISAPPHMTKWKTQKTLAAAKKAFRNKVDFKGTPRRAEGMDYHAFIFKNNVVLRQPKNKDAENRVRTDFFLLKCLTGNVKARLPEPISHDAHTKMAVYGEVRGTPVSVTRFKKFNGHRKEKFAANLAVFIGQLQATKIAKIKNQVDVVTSSSYVVELKSYYSECSKHDLEAPVKRALEQVAEARKKIKTSFAPKLIHGDLGDEHIYTGQKRNDALGFIDFSDARVDDPAREFSSLYCYGESFVTKVYAHYKGNKDKDFLKRAKLYRMEEAVKILSYAVRNDSSMTLDDAKKLLLERVNA